MRPHYEDFPLKSYDKVRFGDTDRQGHVNNALFSTFFETGKAELLYAKVPLNDESSVFVLVDQKIELLSEIHWPGTVEVGTAVARIGNSSISFFQGLYQNGKLVALSDNVMVQMDEHTRKSKPLSDETREQLKQYLVEKSLFDKGGINE